MHTSRCGLHDSVVTSTGQCYVLGQDEAMALLRSSSVSCSRWENYPGLCCLPWAPFLNIR